ncbi:MAG: EF-hand domain-containing protein, partial [Deltaproteobacteria bacterium]
MPDPVGNNNSSLLRSFFNGTSATTNTGDAAAVNVNTDPGGATGPDLNANGFEVGANTGGRVYSPFIHEGLYDDLGGASTRAKGNVDIGTYSTNGTFSYGGKLSRDANTANNNWSTRNTWKGSTNRSTEGLGSTRGAQTENKTESSLKVGGLFVRDRAIGAQAKASGSVEGRYGSASGSARVYSEVGAKGIAQFGLTKTGFTAGATAEARVVAAGAEVSGKISTPSVRVGGQDINLNADVFGRATVEANANVGGEVAFDRDPPKAVLTGKAGAFAGAKAYGRARFGIGDLIKVGVYGEGWAGAGAEASGTIGYQDGKFSLGGSVGAGLGLGGKVGLRVDVDVVKAAQLAKDVADVDRDGKLTLNDGATAITKTADAAMTGVENTVDRTLNAIDADGDGRFSRRDLGLHATRLKANLQNALDANNDGKIGLDDVGAAGRRVGQGLAQGAQALGRGAQALGRGAGELAEAAGKAAHNLADVNNDG